MKVDVDSSYPSFENRDLFVELGEHIAFYRRRANYTQKELSERIHISGLKHQIQASHFL